MNRTLLGSAIEDLVSDYGYSFTLNDESNYPTTLHRYPAAYMFQPKFVRIEGRKHGRITYKVSLQLAQQGAKLSPAERSSLIAEMEQQMVDIFVQLSKAEQVALVEELSISPASQAIDNHGAVTISGNAEVVTIF